MWKWNLFRVGVSIGSIAVAFIPVELLILAKYIFAPQGFWQNFALAGVGIICLGFIQFILFIALVVWLFILWSKD